MTLTLVPKILPDDNPRTRSTDPVTSHQAADVSARSLRETKTHVLAVVRDNGPVTGSAINDLYVFAGARFGWKEVAWDSPRKRAGELVEDGYLEVHDFRPAPGNHLPEASYKLTDLGKRLMFKKAVPMKERAK
jgi:hypothetical protein